MTLPTYLSEHGFVTAGVGKIFHPDGCTLMHEPKDYGTNFSHRVGDDIRGWNHVVPSPHPTLALTRPYVHPHS